MVTSLVSRVTKLLKIMLQLVMATVAMSSFLKRTKAVLSLIRQSYKPAK